jgi:hypothetical protein
MMFGADQIVAHLVGDYLFQSHAMATRKTKQTAWALFHAVTYTAAFLLITQSLTALAIICGTHFLIDRFRLARFVVWLKNGGQGPITATGYPDDVPPWMAVWLLIIADNTLHILINGLAVQFA